MTYTLEELKAMCDGDGNLDLRNTGITALPEGLTVGGWLDLRGTGITALPEGLTVGGSLYLRGTSITALPEGLTVGGSLYLRGTSITALPEGLTVGGSLDLSGTGITALPEGLTVGGWLDLSGTGIKNRRQYKKLRNGDYVEGRYIYCDNDLVHVKRKKQIGEYTYFVGKIKGVNVVSDGTHYAHCKSFEEGVADLAFKRAKDRGADQYKGYTLDTVVSFEEAKIMYRIITGACSAGTERFVAQQKEVKEAYTVRELIEITVGQYGSGVFKTFFAKGERA